MVMLAISAIAQRPAGAVQSGTESPHRLDMTVSIDDVLFFGEGIDDIEFLVNGESYFGAFQLSDIPAAEYTIEAVGAPGFVFDGMWCDATPLGQAPDFVTFGPAQTITLNDSASCFAYFDSGDSLRNHIWVYSQIGEDGVYSEESGTLQARVNGELLPDLAAVEVAPGEHTVEPVEAPGYVLYKTECVANRFGGFGEVLDNPGPIYTIAPDQDLWCTFFYEEAETETTTTTTTTTAPVTTTTTASTTTTTLPDQTSDVANASDQSNDQDPPTLAITGAWSTWLALVGLTFIAIGATSENLRRRYAE